MARNAKILTPTVHIVLDTNALFSEAEDKLVKDSISAFIRDELPKFGTPTVWYIPDIVRRERRRQMVERALLLIKHVEKAEKILGVGLGISERSLTRGVEDVIEREMQQLPLREIALDTSAVDWSRIIDAAVDKSPPFSPGDEKGFKDALIIESLVQLVDQTPASPDNSRIVFICSDNLLRSYASKRLVNRRNTRVIEGLGDLRTILAAVASHLSPELTDEIIEKAQKLFYEGDEESLWVKFGVDSLFLKSPLYNRVPENSFAIKDREYWRKQTTLISKRGQTVEFTTDVLCELTATREIRREPITLPSADISSYLTNPETTGLRADAGTLQSTLTGLTSSPLGSLSSNTLLGQPTLPLSSVLGFTSNPTHLTETITKKGKQTIGVRWSATLTAQGRLTRAVFLMLEDKGLSWL